MLFIFIHIFTAFFVCHSFGHLPYGIGFLLSGIHLLNFLKCIYLLWQTFTLFFIWQHAFILFCFFKFIFVHYIILYWHTFSLITLNHSTVFFFFILFNFTILYWFCHISKWICHRYTCVPHPEPSSLLRPHTIPLGRPSAPAPSIQYRTSNLDWRLVSYMILYMFLNCQPDYFQICYCLILSPLFIELQICELY